MKIRKLLSVFLCALILLGLIGTAQPVHASDFDFTVNVGQTKKSEINVYPTDLTNVKVTAKVTSGSGYVSDVKATSEVKGDARHLYLTYKGRKAGTAKIKYTFSYTHISQSFTVSWTVSVKVTKATSYPYYNSIYVNQLPYKTVYNVGDHVDTSGLEIRCEEVNSGANISHVPLGDDEYSLSPTVFNATGTQKVTVTAKLRDKDGDIRKFTCSFTVTVHGAVKKPSITKHPYGETVETGGSCNFTARADGAEKIEWFFVSPTGAEITAKSASSQHPGLKVSGYAEEKLKLTHIPASLNGWSVYVTFTNSKGSVDSKQAAITVSDAPTVTPASTATPAPTATPVPTAAPVSVPQTDAYAFGVNCYLNGTSMLLLKGSTEITAVPILPADMIFDGWKVNGAMVSTERRLVLTVSETTVVEALFHPEKKITCVNCSFRFEDAEGDPAGDPLQTFSFEYEYAHPVTGALCPAGTLTGYVTAVVPEGKKLDGWIVNGVEYRFTGEVLSFRVGALDAPATYEAVLSDIEPAAPEARP